MCMTTNTGAESIPSFTLAPSGWKRYELPSPSLTTLSNRLICSIFNVHVRLFVLRCRYCHFWHGHSPYWDSFPMFPPSNHVKLQIFLKLMMTCFELTELCTAVHWQCVHGMCSVGTLFMNDFLVCTQGWYMYVRCKWNHSDNDSKWLSQAISRSDTGCTTCKTKSYHN